MVLGVRTLLAEVQSMPRAVGFYRELLGLSPGYVSEHWADFDLGELRLGLHPPFSDGGEPDAVKPGWCIAFEVEDLRGLRRRLEEAQVRILGDYHEIPGGVILEFADPDGHRLQAMQKGVAMEDLK